MVFFLLVPLIDFPLAVLEKVVELFYYGEIRVPTSLKVKVYKALKFLEVDDVPIEVPRAIAKPAKPLSSDVNQMETFTLTGGLMVPTNGMNSIRAFFSSRYIYINEFYS